ncbi:helix-turn-helix domain-containing protein [Streptacidiphilus sp. MAP12-33]|uniref:helix-turn-helix domain-containing protein n=1 Tax=Streptacidiphilus sp. MAP12-33 TaxID=3156266 RepID=UPI00351457AF
MTDEPDVFEVETDEQLRAVGSLARHRVLRVLRDGPATITQIAERLGIAKGSSNHHVKVLAKAGLIHVVETRQVRGVTERYYAIVAKAIKLPRAAGDTTEHLVRHALADMESSPNVEQRFVSLKHVRLSHAAFAEFNDRLRALVEELASISDPGEAAADLLMAFYRPNDPLAAERTGTTGTTPENEDEDA